jgi:hypothetical protein
MIKVESLNSTFMKLVLASIALFLFTIVIYSQPKTPSENFKFHSVSLSPNLVFVKGKTGLVGELDIVFSKNKHLFKLALTGGGEVDVCVLGPCRTVSFASYDFLYGREFKTADWFSIDVFAGVGYFYLKSPDPDSTDYIKEYTVGIPLQTRFRFLASNKINVGVHIYGI